MTEWYMLFCAGLFLFCGGFIAGNAYTVRLRTLAIYKAILEIKPKLGTGTQYSLGMEQSLNMFLKQFGLELREDVKS